MSKVNLIRISPGNSLVHRYKYLTQFFLYLINLMDHKPILLAEVECPKERHICGPCRSPDVSRYALLCFQPLLDRIASGTCIL